jgi:hypothetical protein
MCSILPAAVVVLTVVDVVVAITLVLVVGAILPMEAQFMFESVVIKLIF